MPGGLGIFCSGDSFSSMNLYTNHRMTDIKNDRKMNFALKVFSRTFIDPEELKELNHDVSKA